MKYFTPVENCEEEVVAPCRFELQSHDPESRMIDHYTTGLCETSNNELILIPYGPMFLENI